MADTSATVLIADDDQAICTVLRQALTEQGYNVRTTGHPDQLWTWVDQGKGDVVLTDVLMPDGNGLELARRITREHPQIRVVVMSARNTLTTAIDANREGAFEYLPKPFDIQEVLRVVARALDTPPEPELAGEEFQDETLPLVGRSLAMQDVYRILGRLVGTDLTVLIHGESGTGKELVARALHSYSKRSEHPFVAVNMAAIPSDLIESELFGHEKGAFTGASQRNAGRFEQAKGGVLFLDEIGDMPLQAQTRLLRVLQEGEYTTVGGHRPIRADVRIVSATHRDLAHLVHQGSFREDLFYRLNVVPVRLPPLRERRDDIPALISHFSARLAAENLTPKRIDAGGMSFLKSYAWPGNVRELENLMRRLAALYAQDVIGRDILEQELNCHGDAEGHREDDSLGKAVERHLQGYFKAHGDSLPPPGLYERILREVERPLITLALGATGGNQSRTADLLGVNRNTLRKKIRQLNIANGRNNE